MTPNEAQVICSMQHRARKLYIQARLVAALGSRKAAVRLQRRAQRMHAKVRAEYEHATGAGA